MRRLLIAVILASLPLSAQAQTKRIGNGGESCGTWTQEHSSQETTVGSNMWLDGFLGGASVYTAGPDWFAGTDFNANVAWVTNYCRDHPLDTVVTAVKKLVTELQNRKK